MVRWVAAPPAVVRIGFPFQRAGLLVEHPGRGVARRHFALRPALGVRVAELYWGTTSAYAYFTDEKTRDFVASRIDHLAVELAAEEASDYDEVAP